MDSRWQYFTEEELGNSDKMDNDFMSSLVLIRRLAGFPFIVTSAYRTPEHNAEISTTGLIGPHTTGKAADILISGERAFTLLKLALTNGFTGIGIKQKGPYKGRFIHLDTVASDLRPRCWSY